MKKNIENLTKTEKLMVLFLADNYELMYDTDEFDYETVDRYYAYLGYDLMAEPLLQSLGINSTSDLQEFMLTVEEYL